MKQKFTSANTSINTTKLPAIYNMLPLEKLRGLTIFDYGCGKKETVELIQKKLEPYDIDFIGYDIYNLSDADNCYAFERRKEANIYICSNVLNVIKENEIVQQIINDLSKWAFRSGIEQCPIFIKIYEGNKTGIGQETKKDCWQKNLKTKEYLTLFDFPDMYAKTYKGIIVNIEGQSLLKKGK